MSKIKKVVLPPKPVIKPRVAPTTTSPVKDPTNIRDIKAVEYKITLADGTYLSAKGEHADVLFRYLAECERVATSAMMVNLEAPSFQRFNADGSLLSAGSTSVDIKRSHIRS
jgi:hypothetical protein